MYMQSFRSEGIFYEDVTNRILDDLVAILDPIELVVKAEFTPRGGISTIVRVAHSSEHHGP